MGAWQALTGAPAVIVRTAQHPVAAQLAALRADVRTCDDLYGAHAAFADVYAAIVARVLDAAGASTPGLVYAVPGHPLVGEITTRRLLDEARAAACRPPCWAAPASWSRPSPRSAWIPWTGAKWWTPCCWPTCTTPRWKSACLCWRHRCTRAMWLRT
ncbi:MAG: hypothetical protein R2854_13320 [Caldilineaceae bacterium]